MVAGVAILDTFVYPRRVILCIYDRLMACTRRRATMTKTYRGGFLSALLLALPLAACGNDVTVGEIGGDGDELPPSAELEQPFTSDVATLMDFEFNGELTSTSGSNIRGQVRAQLMFTVGQLNGEKG